MGKKLSETAKRKQMLLSYVKGHILVYLVDMLIMITFVFLVLNLCDAGKIVPGVVCAVVYSLGKAAYDIYSFGRRIAVTRKYKGK